MKKIIVTGGAGFIGSAYVRHAILNGFIVCNVDKLSYASNLSNVASVDNHENYSFTQIDICDEDAMSRLIEKFEPDALIHFAAESHVDRSISNPSDFIKSNILGTYNLLSCCENYYKNCCSEVFRFIHISTDEVFGSLDFSSHNKFDEGTPYDPSSPYSASKASSDHLVRAWVKTYDFPAIITNCTNNYGPFQNSEKFIPTIIRSALRGTSIPIYGNGENIRDWLYVDDHVDAISKVLKYGEVGETYTVGGENEFTNNEVATIICRLLDEIAPKKVGKYEDLIEYVEDRKGHDLRYAVDCSKIKREINWNQRYKFQDGIETTIKWYVENSEWWNT